MGSLKKPLGNWVMGDHYEYQILVVRGGCRVHQLDLEILTRVQTSSLFVLIHDPTHSQSLVAYLRYL